MENNYLSITKNNWQHFLEQKGKSRKLVIAFCFLFAILYCFPFFFQYIQQRSGIVINDAVLDAVPASDVSIPIFIFIWSSAVLILFTAIQNPETLSIFMLAYVQLSLIRIMSISIFPLQTPPGLIPLTDPLANHFYGVNFITKDLFFSGHTSALFLMFLCQKNKVFRYYTLLASVCVGMLVLVQHVHYTIDVIFAFPFAYLCFASSKCLILTGN